MLSDKNYNRGGGAISGDQTNGGGGVFYLTPILTRQGKSVNLMCIATHVPTGLYRLIL